MPANDHWQLNGLLDKLGGELYLPTITSQLSAPIMVISLVLSGAWRGWGMGDIYLTATYEGESQSCPPGTSLLVSLLLAFWPFALLLLLPLLFLHAVCPGDGTNTGPQKDGLHLTGNSQTNWHRLVGSTVRLVSLPACLTLSPSLPICPSVHLSICPGCMANSLSTLPALGAAKLHSTPYP